MNRLTSIRIKFNIFFALLLFLSIKAEANESLPYLSPGIRLGYVFGQGLTFQFKMSFGIVNFHYAFDFYNITYGYRFPLFRSTKSKDKSFHFLDLQAGHFPQNEDAILNFFNGGGLGLFFYNEKGNIKYGYRATLFTGLWVFANFDVNFYSKRKIIPDLGIEGVLPAPLRKIDF